MSDCFQFLRTATRDGFRVMIQSTCAGCGETRIVSHVDGSLEKWEQEHRCSVDEGSIHLLPAS
jgi:hypothetical protein